MDRKAQLAGVFSRAASGYDTVGPSYFARLGRRLVELAAPTPGERVLDVATGRGAVLFPVAERVGPEGAVLGVDLADEMVMLTGAEARQRGLGHVRVQQMDAERLLLPDAAFDGVFCAFALFFLPDPLQALGEFRRVLRPGGRLAVSTWGPEDENWKWFGERLRAHLPAPAAPAQDEPPWRFDTPEGMSAILTAAGFEGVTVTTEQEALRYASGEQWWDSLWTHGMREALEQLSPEALRSLRDEALARFGPNEHPTWHATVLYTLATRPQERPHGLLSPNRE